MELVNKKKNAEENTSSNEVELESVSDSHIVQNNSFSNLDLTAIETKVPLELVHQLLEY